MKSLAFKKTISALFALALVLQLLPVSVSAATAPGGEVASATDLASALGSANVNVSGNTVTLTGSVTLNGPIVIADGEYTIRGGNRTIARGAAGNLISVQSGASLTLENTTLNGENEGVSDFASVVYVSGGANLTMNSGTIKGSAGLDGGGVHVSGVFTMNGGEISENIAYEYGGGVYVGSGGAFTMKGGTIDSNLTEYGGGVYVDGGTFEMTGGAISNNESSGGGGVYVNSGGVFTLTDGTISGHNSVGGGVLIGSGSAFTMNGGEINGNTTSASGGGVYVSSGGTFAINGGKINGNTTTGSGGGVYVSTGGALKMNGGEITNSTATYRGGGVCVGSGTFEMTDGLISGNTAGDSGGGVQIIYGSRFTMKGGIITGNEAVNRGGGVCNGAASTSPGTFTTGGTAVIKGNTKSGTPAAANNVFLYIGNYITLATGADSPKKGMEIYVQGTIGDIIVESGASKSHAKCFQTDNSELEAAYSGGQLVLQEYVFKEPSKGRLSFNGLTWFVPADSTEDLILSRKGWTVEAVFANSAISGYVQKSDDETHITVKPDVRPFSAVAKMKRDDEIRYIGIEKPFSVSPETFFDGKTWIIPYEYTGAAVMEFEDWTAECAFLVADDSVLPLTDKTITVTEYAEDFEAIAKLSGTGGKKNT